MYCSGKVTVVSVLVEQKKKKRKENFVALSTILQQTIRYRIWQRILCSLRTVFVSLLNFYEHSERKFARKKLFRVSTVVVILRFMFIGLRRVFLLNWMFSSVQGILFRIFVKMCVLSCTEKKIPLSRDRVAIRLLKYHFHGHESEFEYVSRIFISVSLKNGEGTTVR